MHTAPVSLHPRRSQQGWTDEARCKGRSDLFFPAPSERGPDRLRREAVARELCGECPVRVDCKEYGREHLEHGIWGGETEIERALAGHRPPHLVGVRRLHAAEDAQTSKRDESEKTAVSA